MTLKESLGLFTDAVIYAATYAPDEYPKDSWLYNEHRTDILRNWSQIYPKVRIHTDKAKFVDQKLQEAFTAFDVEGDKVKGRQALFDIYNAQPRKLR